MTAAPTLSQTSAHNPLAGCNHAAISRPDWTVRRGLTFASPDAAHTLPLEFRPKSKRDRKR